MSELLDQYLKKGQAIRIILGEVPFAVDVIHFFKDDKKLGYPQKSTLLLETDTSANDNSLTIASEYYISGKPPILQIVKFNSVAQLVCVRGYYYPRGRESDVFSIEPLIVNTRHKLKITSKELNVQEHREYSYIVNIHGNKEGESSLPLAMPMSKAAAFLNPIRQLLRTELDKVYVPNDERYAAKKKLYATVNRQFGVVRRQGYRDFARGFIISFRNATEGLGLQPPEPPERQ